MLVKLVSVSRHGGCSVASGLVFAIHLVPTALLYLISGGGASSDVHHPDQEQFHPSRSLSTEASVILFFRRASVCLDRNDKRQTTNDLCMYKKAAPKHSQARTKRNPPPAFPLCLPGRPYSFQSSFLSDSHPTTAAAVLARFGDDSGTGGALSTGKGKGAGGGAPAGEGDSQPRPGSFLEAVDMAAGGSASEGVSFAA